MPGKPQGLPMCDPPFSVLGSPTSRPRTPSLMPPHMTVRLELPDGSTTSVELEPEMGFYNDAGEWVEGTRDLIQAKYLVSDVVEALKKKIPKYRTRQEGQIFLQIDNEKYTVNTQHKIRLSKLPLITIKVGIEPKAPHRVIQILDRAGRKFLYVFEADTMQKSDLEHKIGEMMLGDGILNLEDSKRIMVTSPSDASGNVALDKVKDIFFVVGPRPKPSAGGASKRRRSKSRSRSKSSMRRRSGSKSRSKPRCRAARR